jgi:Antitoxin of toxin-antitoxin, RelE / RelB, TA system
MYAYPMRAPLTVSTFRKEMSPRLNSVLHDHLPLPVQRGRDELALLLGAPEVKVLLANHHFNPEVSAGEEGGFSIWLAELEIYGQGPDYDAAKQDLLDEVRDYVDEYLSDSTYVRAPNRALHLPYIVRAYIADREGDLAQVIFGTPDSQSVLEAAPQLAA